MEERLPLLGPATPITLHAVQPDLRYMAADGFPAFYLPFVIETAPPHEIPAVPLEPSPWVFRINPILFPPIPQGLGSVHTEEI